MTVAERPLTDDERGDLMARLANARSQRAFALVKPGGASLLVCGVLAILTLLASDAPAIVVALFWSVLWLVFTLWIGLPGRRLMAQQVPMLEDALLANRARVMRIQSPRVVEFEEEEDEGACYAFEIDATSSLFMIGQEFYEDDDFPNSDFSMVEILGTRGHAVDVLLVKHGRKLMPVRVVPAAIKNELELPEHLEVVNAPLDRIESALARLATAAGSGRGR